MGESEAVADKSFSTAELLTMYVRRLVVLREAAGESRTKIAQGLAMTRGNLSHILEGRNRVTPDALDAVAAYEGRGTDALLRDLALLATELAMGAPPVVRLPSGAIVRLDVAVEAARQGRPPKKHDH